MIRESQPNLNDRLDESERRISRIDEPSGRYPQEARSANERSGVGRVIRSQIEEAALQVGFSGVGVSRISELPPQNLKEWLSREYQGKMSYLERNVEKRLDPRQILPGAESIISVSLNYYWEYRLPYEDPRVGVVSRYAQGENYHRVMEKMLEEFLSAIRRIVPGAEGKYYVDTGPVLEKEWAARAGLGWFGKNTNLIDGKRGSWFFLGEVLTNLDLDPDESVPDYCGTCNRCIEECPTGAIVEPYVLDASRCISYLTIELREEIPVSLRRKMGNLVFGCDICQDVCPWNRNPERSVLEEFNRPRGVGWDLTELSRMNPAQFNRRFRASPVRRSKWRGFMRNVAVAMGNSRSEDFVEDLERLAREEDVLVRSHALWALEQIETKKSRRALERLRAS